jgi:triacylglycerol lipase
MPLEPRLTPMVSEINSLTQLERFLPPAEDAGGKLGPREYEFFQQCSRISFETTVKTYSAANAWYLSDLAYLAYTDRETIDEVQQAVRPALARMFRSRPQVKAFIGLAKVWGTLAPHDRIQCIVAHDASMGLVAFRGTLPQSIPNWLTDADFVPTREAGPVPMHVHAGFQGALDCVWQPGQAEGVEHYLAEVVANNANLTWWFTGHSLGAALAALATRRFGRAHALYTYGSPKVGDAAFVEQLTQSVAAHYRIVNHRDIVTHLPTVSPYEHAGSLKHIRDLEPSSPVIPRLWQYVRKFLGREPLWDTTAQELFNELGRLKSDFEDARLLRVCLDHVPIFYSKILWNQLIASTND